MATVVVLWTGLNLTRASTLYGVELNRMILSSLLVCVGTEPERTEQQLRALYTRVTGVFPPPPQHCHHPEPPPSGVAVLASPRASV